MFMFKVRLLVRSTLLLSSCVASVSMAQQVTVRNLNNTTLTACGSLACLPVIASAVTGPIGNEPLATAVGLSATVRAPQGTAVGFGAETSGVNSVSVGVGSRDNGLSNVFSVGSIGGERQIINVAPGTVAAGSTDAVNGGQLFAAVQQGSGQALAVANSANSTAAQALSTANTANATAAQALTAANAASLTLADLSRNSNAGTATAIASANIPQAYGPGRTAIGGAVGTWRGETSFAVGASHNFTGFSVRGSFNVDTRGSTGGGAGFGVQF